MSAPAPAAAPVSGPSPSAPVGARFHCRTYHCDLSTSACLARQKARMVFNAPAHPWCASGRCAQGNQIKKENES